MEETTHGRDRTLRIGSTFSGVGGADLGLERAGMELAWTCEWDEWKRSVLAAHWPDVPHYSDVRDLADKVAGLRRVQSDHDGRRYADDAERHALAVDLLCGGFPCQDLSVAGKRRGFNGERSVLAFEFLRIAESLRPRWLLMENVPGLLSSNGGRDMARLLDELGACGYGWAYRILDARYFGVPQRRRRIFICARRADAEFNTRAAAGLALRALWEGSGGDSTPGWPPRQNAPAGVGSGAKSGRLYNSTAQFGQWAEGDAAGTLVRRDAKSPKHLLVRKPIAFSHTQGLDEQASEQCWPTIRKYGGGHAVASVVNALDRQAGGPDDNSAQAGHLIPQTTHTLTSVGADSSEDNHMSVRRLTPVECERLMGWPDDWTAPPGVKAPDSKRYAACGDGIVSWVAYWIGCRIQMIEAEATDNALLHTCIKF